MERESPVRLDDAHNMVIERSRHQYPGCSARVFPRPRSKVVVRSCASSCEIILVSLHKIMDLVNWLPLPGGQT